MVSFCLFVACNVLYLMLYYMIISLEHYDCFSIMIVLPQFWSCVLQFFCDNIISCWLDIFERKGMLCSEEKPEGSGGGTKVSVH